MASFTRRGRTWQAQVAVSGVRRAATFDTKAEAKAWAADMELSIRRAGAGGADTLFSVVIQRYLEEVVPEHRGAKWEEVRLKRIETALGRYTLRELLVGDQLASWRNARSKEVQAGSVRREMNLLNQVFQAAMNDWRLIDANPLTRVRKPKAPAHRERVISSEEVEKMVAALNFNGWLVETSQHQTALAFLIALETAMRLSEVLSIPAGFDGKVYRTPVAKNGEARDVPLSARARELVALIPDGGFSVSSDTVSVLFARARARCGFPNGKAGGFTFHDSRATALTQLSKKLDVLALAKMVGHRDPRSLMIYYRESLADIADRL